MQQIGRYQITGELGRGAMGVVYRALDPSIGRTVAIKTIRLNEFTDPNERMRLRDRLLREARSAGVLSHPNIVTIYDVAEQDGLAYIAMEYVDGPTLDRMLATEPPDRDLVLSIIRQTAVALDYAHSKGVVHRDIKPANIMIHERKTAKITDFGVARLQSQQMTQAGVLLGTPNYMSPEQIQGVPVDGPADQFSLAVIAYELLTGERPFAGDSMPTVIFKIVHEAPVAPRRLNPSLGWPVDTVLERALAKKPADRYATCTEFATALENACRASGDWRPLAPGGAEALPTIIDNPLQTAEGAAQPEVPVMVPPPRSFEEPEPVTPAIVRAARALAILILAAGAVGFAVWGAMQWLGAPRAETAATPVPPVAKPAPTEIEGRPPAPETPPAASQQKPATEQSPDTHVDEAPAETEPPPMPRKTQRETAPPEAPPKGPQPVHFITTPPGATVRLDDGQTCTTPCDLNLESGRHTITADVDGYRRALRIADTSRESEIYIPLEKASGTVAVRSTPSGATITLNGEERSEKTPAIIALPPGRYRIEVSREGSQKWSGNVEVKDNALVNVDVTLPR